MKFINNSNVLNQVASIYHIKFDPNFKYCISDSFENEIGNLIPNYLPIIKNKVIHRIYVLKFIDGCFNQYLYEIDLKTKDKKFMIKMYFQMAMAFENEHINMKSFPKAWKNCFKTNDFVFTDNMFPAHMIETPLPTECSTEYQFSNY